MKILITGHKGYIGSHLFSDLKRLGYNVRGIDIKDGEDILHCLPDEDFNYVFHFAAQPRVEFSVQHPSYTMKWSVGYSRNSTGLIQYASDTLMLTLKIKPSGAHTQPPFAPGWK